jgi:hypothetical protein
MYMGGGFGVVAGPDGVGGTDSNVLRITGFLDLVHGKNFSD